MRVLACALAIHHQDIERAIDQYTWSLPRRFFSRNALAGELRLPRACFAPAGQQACCHRNRGKATLVFAVCINIHGASKTTYATNTISSMPKGRKKPSPSPGEVVSSSEATMSSSEETDSSPSPPPPPTPRGTPERADHHARRNERNPPHAQSPRRQPVDRLGPPRPRPSNSGRQMFRLDVDREVRQLERARRQQPESFGRRRPAARRGSAPARASIGHSRRASLERLLAQLRSFEEEERRERIHRIRERQARAARLLASDDNARTISRI